MPSISALIGPSKSDLQNQAREADVKVSQPKADLILELAEEATPDIRDELRSILTANKSALQKMAGQLGIDGEQTADALRRQLVSTYLSRQSTHKTNVSKTYPDSDDDGTSRRPRGQLTSHFESAEVRQEAIQKAAHRATDRAFREMRSYVVVESFRPKDAKEPLWIQPASYKRHPDTVTVFEVRVPHSPYPLATADPNPIRMPTNS